MKTINVYGSGCKNCITTAEHISKIATEQGLDITVNKVTDLEAIMTAGVVSTPAVGTGSQLLHSGSVPTEAEIKQLLAKI